MFDFFKKLFSNQIEENQEASSEVATTVVERPGGAEQVHQAIDKTRSTRARALRPVRTTPPQ